MRCTLAALDPPTSIASIVKVTTKPQLPTAVDRPAGPSPGDRPHSFVSRHISETQSWLNARLRRDLRLEPLGPLGPHGFEARLTADVLAGAHFVRSEYPAGMRLKHGDAGDDLTISVAAAGVSVVR